MSARAAMTFRAVAWALIAAVVTTSAPVAGFVLGGGAVALALWGQSRGKSPVWTKPLLGAGVMGGVGGAAFILATL